jgi:hypothetical protein
MSIWVVSTSPLVFLGNLGRLVLLRHEGREVYIPCAVAESVSNKAVTERGDESSDGSSPRR